MSFTEKEQEIAVQVLSGAIPGEVAKKHGLTWVQAMRVVKKVVYRAAPEVLEQIRRPGKEHITVGDLRPHRDFLLPKVFNA